MSRTSRGLIAMVALLAVSGGVASRGETWQLVDKSRLQVTGDVSPTSQLATLRTRSPDMAAVELDKGLHARQARLRFRFLGNSLTTTPLGSGKVVRQIGLEMRALNPCNLVYVMWRDWPIHAIDVSVKRNPGQTTFVQCGNRGYTTLAVIPMAPRLHADHATRELRVSATPAGAALSLRVFANGSRVYGRTVPASLIRGLTGPAGLRSDDGDYIFQLAVRDRGP